MLILRILNPTTTAAAPAATTMAPVTTPSVPQPFNTWFPYKNCRYSVIRSPSTHAAAITGCTSLGANCALASVNVRLIEDRTQIFMGTNSLNLPVWVHLEATANNVGASTWNAGATPFSTQPGVPAPTYNPTGTSCAYVGSPLYSNFVFDPCISPFSYLCEYCPP